jgi:hypothetical protein
MGRRSLVLAAKLPELLERIKKLEKQVRDLSPAATPAEAE